MNVPKSDTRPKNRTPFTTTLDTTTTARFKKYCKEQGIAMNIVLEAFMRQFCDGEFQIDLRKKNDLDLRTEYVGKGQDKL